MLEKREKALQRAGARYALARAKAMDERTADLHDVYDAETSRDEKCRRKRAYYMATRQRQ